MGKGKVKKRKWRYEFDRDSLKKNKYSPEIRRKRFTPHIKKIPITENKLPITKVEIKKPERKKETKSQIIVKKPIIQRQEPRIPYTSLTPEVKTVSAYVIKELLEMGNYAQLDRIIMRNEQPLLLGSMHARYKLKGRDPDFFAELGEKNVKLAIYHIDDKPYFALYFRNGRKIYLIVDISKNGLITLMPYVGVSLPISNASTSYSADLLREWHGYSSCLSMYQPQKA